MIRVRFIKSCASSSTSYSKGAVAWLEEDKAASYMKSGLCVPFEENAKPTIIVQETKEIATVQEIKPKRKRKK